MKERISFLCKTAFLQIRHISTIRHYLTDNAIKTLVSLVLSRIDSCNSLLAGLLQSSVGKLQTVQTCAAPLVVRAPLIHVHITSILRHLHWVSVRDRISYKIACLRFNAIIPSTPAYLSDLLHLCSPSRPLRSSADAHFLKI